MQLIFAEVSAPRLRRTLRGLDLQTLRFSGFRGTLVLAQLTILVATPYDALMQTLVGSGAGPVCDGLRNASTYCLGRSLPDALVTSAMVMILIGVAAGVAPTVMAILHAWVAFSIAGSISLPDGGDQAAAVCTLLLVAVSFADRRRWLLGPPHTVANWRRQVALAGLMVMRVQVTAIYFNAAIAKLFAPEWVNGTAEYYVLRDPFFGASGPLAPVLQAATTLPAVTVGVTWGAVIVEIAIGVLILCGPRSRSIALVLCVVLHGAIIITMGLWSFGLIMIAIVGIAAMPYTPHEQTHQFWSRLGRRQHGTVHSPSVNGAGVR
ncbi:sporulation-delaying protein SdpB family protein [Curtobacterium sp. MCBA15_007]|uniref:sporulation-delaying protein SdpB family protein n=1 Tax=Curtobacterium sp. MCBA15_007 TaxID=1898735 RepID=UPI0009F24D6C|nr:sporulation-delaying protein SdpB family protein [Curtobacterium sp. MCBA15_007]